MSAASLAALEYLELRKAILTLEPGNALVLLHRHTEVN
jgi:hypothetical protein